jgi:hypothetical protein
MIHQVFVSRNGVRYQIYSGTPNEAEGNAAGYARFEARRTIEQKPMAQRLHRAARLRANIARRKLPHGFDKDKNNITDPRYLPPHNSAPHKHS